MADKKVRHILGMSGGKDSTVTFLVLTFASLLGGTILTEVTFS